MGKADFYCSLCYYQIAELPFSQLVAMQCNLKEDHSPKKFAKLRPTTNLVLLTNLKSRLTDQVKDSVFKQVSNEASTLRKRVISQDFATECFRYQESSNDL